MAKIVKCPLCGKEFVTARPNKKYCSFICREAGRKLQRMKWDEKNPQYSAEYMRSYRATKKRKDGKDENEP